MIPWWQRWLKTGPPSTTSDPPPTLPTPGAREDSDLAPPAHEDLRAFVAALDENERGLLLALLTQKPPPDWVTRDAFNALAARLETAALDDDTRSLIATATRGFTHATRNDANRRYERSFHDDPVWKRARPKRARTLLVAREPRIVVTGAPRAGKTRALEHKAQFELRRGIVRPAAVAFAVARARDVAPLHERLGAEATFPIAPLERLAARLIGREGQRRHPYDFDPSVREKLCARWVTEAVAKSATLAIAAHLRADVLAAAAAAPPKAKVTPAYTLAGGGACPRATTALLAWWVHHFGLDFTVEAPDHLLVRTPQRTLHLILGASPPPTAKIARLRLAAADALRHDLEPRLASALSRALDATLAPLDVTALWHERTRREPEALRAVALETAAFAAAGEDAVTAHDPLAHALAERADPVCAVAAHRLAQLARNRADALVGASRTHRILADATRALREGTVTLPWRTVLIDDADALTPAGNAFAEALRGAGACVVSSHLTPQRTPSRALVIDLGAPTRPTRLECLATETRPLPPHPAPSLVACATADPIDDALAYVVATLKERHPHADIAAMRGRADAPAHRVHTLVLGAVDAPLRPRTLLEQARAADHEPFATRPDPLATALATALARTRVRLVLLVEGDRAPPAFATLLRRARATDPQEARPDFGLDPLPAGQPCPACARSYTANVFRLEIDEGPYGPYVACESRHFAAGQRCHYTERRCERCHSAILERNASVAVCPSCAARVPLCDCALPRPMRLAGAELRCADHPNGCAKTAPVPALRPADDPEPPRHRRRGGKKKT